MKATGIVRKIDELGRIVIPKEIRKNLRIREGDSIEIFIDSNDEIVLKKYSQMLDLTDVAKICVETIYSITGKNCIITDKDSVIAISGNNRKQYIDKQISENIQSVMDDRSVWQKQNEAIDIIRDDDFEYGIQLISPIIVEGDAIGSLIIFSDNKNKDLKITETDIKIIQMTSLFISKQFEI